VSNVTRTASRSGPIQEPEIFAAPQALVMAEDGDILSIASHVVKAALLIMVIQVTIIQNSVARIVLLCLIQNVPQVIQIPVVTYVIMMEGALAHSCLGEAPHATKFFIPE
jgi:hypothetical protein